MTIRLTTLGGLRAFRDDAELDWLPAQRLRAALFVYLAVERRVSRASLLAVFWPERDEAHARQSLRQGLYHLRKLLGDDWLDAQAQELRIGRAVHTDVHAFTAALERGDVEAAARLYTGPFLDGVHLADLEAWESWVDSRRTLYARAFRKASRAWLDARRAAGDLAGAIEAAQCWVKPDPLDDEAQHRLIEALAAAGERAEAIRQYETYARLLEPDGLRPLDETVALIERVRATAAAWPEPSTVPQTTTPHAASSAAPAPTTAQPPIAAREPTPPQPPSPPLTSRGRRPRLVRAAIAALGTLVVAFGALRLAEDRRAADSLVAEGLIAEGERIVLADFGGPRTDPSLGAIITDVLRADLLEAEVFRVLDPAEVREILRRMQVEDSVPLTGELAREVALRGGVKAVLEGAVAQAGTGYVLTAALRAADSNRILAAFRETARGPDEVIPAIERLSRGIRRRAGERLRALDDVAAPANVSTSSLDALRAYTRAVRAFAVQDRERGIGLLEEAVALDPEFGMAWRALGTWLAETEAARKVEAITRAYELRGRMTPRERYLAEAAYHREVTRDHNAEMEAYRRVLEIAPDDFTALHNLALRYRWIGDLDTATALLGRAAAQRDAPAATHLGLIYALLASGRPAQAEEAVRELERRYPGHPSAAGARFWVVLQGSDDDAAATAAVEPLLTAPGVPLDERAWVHEHFGLAALWRGRLAKAVRAMEEAERVARDGGALAHAFASRLRRAYAVAAVADAERGARILDDAIEHGRLDELAPPARARHTQALVYAIAGRPDDAEAALRAFEAEADPALREAYRTRTDAARALAQLQRGEPEEAVRRLQQVRATLPCRYCLTLQMGQALAESGRLREAAAEWEAALAWKDDLFDGFTIQVARNLWILQRLPGIYEELGDTARALHHYRRLAALWSDADPELQPHVRHARARIAALSGDAAAAPR